ncbi:hypothetical protein AB0K48_21575 [Nonomuraea sp. NPDC055795]
MSESVSRRTIIAGILVGGAAAFALQSEAVAGAPDGTVESWLLTTSRRTISSMYFMFVLLSCHP